ncbi:MAG TPA: M13-type metalloendopeptidase, partial [Gammaproteobacteria bacterium]|nr:M13-type metalloendopeptidase [Gammaproteobacteria bacterium]
LVKVMAHLSRIGVGNPFGGYVGADAKNSDQYILYLYQSGLGLPDRDYYLSDAKKFQELRAAYQAHIEKMFRLAGWENPAQAAENIVALETRFAKNHWTRVESRNATKTYNKYSLQELEKLAPAFDWETYFAELGAPQLGQVVVSQPSYFDAFGKAWQDVPLETWKTWYKWNLLNNYASYLSEDFVKADFAFYGTTLSGVPELRPRWKRGVSLVENSLGMAVGKIYVDKYFPPEAKARMEDLVANLIKAYRISIKELDWMSEETKQKALVKLSKFTPKIGYPKNWRSYEDLTIKADDLVGNVMRSNAFATDYQLDKLGGPVDPTEWHMTPQTVNAYYNPVMNEIVFPAAILQPPFFNLEAAPAVNYGGIGAVIGHEIGHGFDDQGSKYDGEGNLNNWWTDADRAQFEKRAQKLIEQYNQYCPLENYCVNGALTIGENIGDLGGLSIAYEAWKLSRNGEPAPVIDGLTGKQRFFMGWAQVWARKYRKEELINRLKTDPHAPSEFRANGVVSNMPAFYKAFNVQPGDGMYIPPEERVKIW